MHIYHNIITQPIKNSSCNHEAEHMTSIKIPTVILLCKHTVLYILNTKCGKGADSAVLFCLFDLILYVPSTIFQLNRGGFSWVEPVLS